jgi:hypothetical protein
MGQQKCRVGRKIAAVLIVCGMISAVPQKTKGLDRWFCIVRDSHGFVVEYKKAAKKFSDTCTAVWFHDRFGYKLFLKNGDSVSICEKCLTGSHFFNADKSKNQQRKK